ncbi:adenylate/guanylate cyclase domain-containing protein [Pseudochryseolinea flava]|uniref:Adenylate/guanylate cyclase domain-containing protein n=1 Tax=Pseudochryseolinea flava TaxID=2059302 RepID=A0A364Y7I3_9BACT|nr:adenylate/guanylate cyclase domain-containing protein [Pseudochryseolinea flava]RAW02937.1 adenylate/guanylate cyclase domain-containing protein [Pseudochryseolinea flava]
MSNRKQIQFKQLTVIAGTWIVAGVLIALYDHLVLMTASPKGAAASYSLLFSICFSAGSGLLGALLGGSFLIFYINVKYQDKPYGYTILSVISSFLLIVLLVSLIRGAITLPNISGKPLLHADTLSLLPSFLLDATRAKNILVWLSIVSITQLLLQFSNKFGQGAFAHIIRGKYNTPQREEKIFLFLDLNSSTQIAEQLGDEKYHALLKDFFADITNPILDNKGEIYQYVGDEVVISWDYQVGIFDNRCIRTFFDIKKCIHDNQDKYLKRYGLVPDFKGGVHSGKVIAGEVGTIKREVTYSGDVLNTTSRILSMCRQLGAEILTSASLSNALTLDKQYVAHSLGAIKLKGKEKEIVLNAISA